MPSLLGGKWVPMIIIALAAGPRRPKTLLHIVGNGMPKKVMLETLQRMETQRLTTHTGAYHDGQTEVRYSLTERGRSLLPVIDTLARWADTDEHVGSRPPPPIGD